MTVSLKTCRRTMAVSVLLMLSALAAPLRSAARSGMPQGLGAGAFFSPFSTGISLRTPLSDRRFKSLDISLELLDVISGRTTDPGLRVAYHHDHILREGVWAAGIPWRLYAGPGITAGRVRERGSRPGLMAGVSGTAGGSAAFDHGITLSVEFQVYEAFLIRHPDAPELRQYKWGLTGAWAPRLRITKNF